MRTTLMPAAVIAVHFLAVTGDYSVSSADETTGAELISVWRIWDEGPHNAFTDLVRHRDKWYCAFREGLKHDGGRAGRGKLRVLASVDGRTWNCVALMSSEEGDLRDPKLEVTPDGRLMLVGFITLYKPKTFKHKSLAWFSEDGARWTEAAEVGDEPLWIWRVTRHADGLYTMGYACNERAVFRLYRSKTGGPFKPISGDLGIRPGEATLVFTEDGTCHALLRVKTARLGTAKPPYTNWTWRDTGIRIGGPEIIQLPDGRFMASGRLYGQDGKTGLAGWATVLYGVDFHDGTLTECLRLPSGGDTSYPGMVYHDKLLWVSYYSSHEEAVTDDYGKSNIYLARVKLTAKGD